MRTNIVNSLDVRENECRARDTHDTIRIRSEWLFNSALLLTVGLRPPAAHCNVEWHEEEEG